MADAADVWDALHDPLWFVPQMVIRDRHGKLQSLGEAGLFWAQMEFLKAFSTDKRILCLKSRQLGITTISLAALLHKVLFSPTAYNVLSVTHEGEAIGRVTSMLRNYLDHLPPALLPARPIDNMRTIQLGTNDSIMNTLMAGGRSQGRSYTYQALHCTEMGFWPSGSAARGGQAVDEEVWASINSTLHESPETRVIIESTADGPGGVFHKMCLTAQQSPDWKFLFFPWFKDPTYARQLTADWEIRPEEQDLVELYGLSHEQVCWRRWKIEEQGYSERRFQQEYPSNPLEPFIIATGQWFDGEKLSTVMGSLPPSLQTQPEGRYIWEDPQQWHRYYIGVDASGGTGYDQGVVQVVRDDLVQVAKYCSRHTSPTQLAEEAASLSALYNKAPVNNEFNSKWGNAVDHRLRALGITVWQDKNGKPWSTTKATKMKLLDYARDCIDGDHVTFNDGTTVSECLAMREQDDGDVRADAGHNDDHVIALALALWNARRTFEARNTKNQYDKHVERQRRSRHRELGVGRGNKR